MSGSSSTVTELPIFESGSGARLATTTTSPSDVSSLSAVDCAKDCVAKRMSGTAAGSRAIRLFMAELPSCAYPGGSRGRMPADSALASATVHHVLPRGPCRHSVGSARAAHPGCSIGRPRQAGLLACGSSPRITFPDSHPVVFDAWQTAYSCGGSPGFYPSSRFNPLEGELVARGKGA